MDDRMPLRMLKIGLSFVYQPHTAALCTDDRLDTGLICATMYAVLGFIIASNLLLTARLTFASPLATTPLWGLHTRAFPVRAMP